MATIHFVDTPHEFTDDEESEVSEEISAVEETSADQPSETAVSSANSEFSDHAESFAYNSNIGKDSNSAGTVIIIIVLIVVAGGIAGAVVFVKKKKN